MPADRRRENWNVLQFRVATACCELPFGRDRRHAGRISTSRRTHARCGAAQHRRREARRRRRHRGARPGPGEVTVKIEATGVCHSDLSGMTGTHPAAGAGVLGHEGAGDRRRRSARAYTVAEGDHVIVAWSPAVRALRQLHRPQVAPPVHRDPVRHGRSCPASPDGEPLFGFAGAGTFAEYTTMPAEARGQDRRRRAVRDRLAHRLRRHHGRRRRDQHGQGRAGLVGRRVRLRRRRHRRHPGRQGRRCGRDRRRRSRRLEARAGQAVRRHPRRASPTSSTP